MATHFAQVLFFRSFYVCFPSGHYFTLVSIFAKDGQRYICARLLSIEAIIAKFHVPPIIIADWRCPLTGPTCCNSINSSLIDFDILLDRRFIYIDAYQVFLLVWLGRLRNVSRSVAWSGITIDWARPSFVNHIVVDKKNQDHHHRIKFIITTTSQRVVGEQFPFRGYPPPRAGSSTPPIVVL